MTRQLFAAATLLAVAGPATAQPAGGPPATYPFPTTAAAVVCVRGVEAAPARFDKMLAAGLPDEAAALRPLVAVEVAKAFDNRSLKGVRPNDPVFLVYPDIRRFGEPAAGTLLFPVTTYQEFRDTYLTADERRALARAANGVDATRTVRSPGTLHLVDLKGYVAVSAAKEMADIYAAAYPRASADHLGKELAAGLAAADAAVYLNMTVVNEQIGDKIGAMAGFYEGIFRQAFSQGGLDPRQGTAVTTMFKGLFRGIGDSRGALLAAEFRPDGLAVRALTRFAPNTASARAAAVEAPDPLDGVAALPAGFTRYGGSRVSEDYRMDLAFYNQEFVPAVGDERGAARLDDALRARADAGRGRVLWAMGPDATFTVSEFREPAGGAKAVVDAHLAVGPGGVIQSVVQKAAPAVAGKATAHRGFTLTEVRLHRDLDGTVARFPAGIYRTAMRDVIRPRGIEKMGVWVGTDGKVVVQVAAETWPAARAVLDRYLDRTATVGAEAGFQTARRGLPAESLYLELQETQDVLAPLAPQFQLVARMFPGLPDLPPVTRAPGPPTYLNSAATIGGDGAGFTVFVPSAAMRVVKQMFSGPPAAP